jgi:hypothetical protein
MTLPPLLSHMTGIQLTLYCESMRHKAERDRALAEQAQRFAVGALKPLEGTE